MYAKSEHIMACFGHAFKKRNILLCDYIPIRMNILLQSIKNMVKNVSCSREIFFFSQRNILKIEWSVHPIK